MKRQGNDMPSLRRVLLIGATCVAMPSIAGAQDAASVVATYADIGAAVYGDSLTTARALDAAVQSFLAAPSAEGLEAARAAWRTARAPYQQSEAFRFGNAVVDAWEGRVNSWPLDEGLIDYVDAASYGDSSDINPFYTANVVANEQLEIGGASFDAKVIDASLIRSLQEVDEVEANVAMGYHAIEFLLWGQDLNGTGPGAGARAWTDYAPGDRCTNGHCDRRAAYLQAATDLLTRDLEEIVGDWAEGGAARAELLAKSPEGGLSAILTGMGSLSYGELAGERMKLGLMLHDPEEEQDCFSDNTYNSHYYDGLGMVNVYRGHYERIDGSTIEGPSLAELVAAKDPALGQEMAERLDATMAALSKIKETADSGAMAYDQMIGEDSDAGNAMVQAAIDGLIAQTRSIERVVTLLGLDAIEFEGSDSLDNPGAIFQ